MAAITARSAKKRVSYHELHSLSTIYILFDGNNRKRRLANKSLGFIKAGRIVASREDVEASAA